MSVNSQLQELLDQAINTPYYLDISNKADKYIESIGAKARDEAADDFHLKMASELGTLKGRYAHDLVLLIGHIVEINKLSNKI